MGAGGGVKWWGLGRGPAQRGRRRPAGRSPGEAVVGGRWLQRAARVHAHLDQGRGKAPTGEPGLQGPGLKVK
jgi:hypothetical protein